MQGIKIKKVLSPDCSLLTLLSGKTILILNLIENEINKENMRHKLNSIFDNAGRSR